MTEILWLSPASITHKIGGASKLHGIVGGDWDRKQVYPFCETAKFKAIESRYAKGADWLVTELFRDTYARRLARDGHIRGMRSLADLAGRYTRRFDALAASLRADGFMLRSPKGKSYPPLSLLVGRDGEMFIGNQGNHRLALAQVLGLSQVAGRIVCRHQLWTP